MTLANKRIRSVGNRTYVDSIFNRILLCCFLIATCCLDHEAAAFFPTQDMTDRVELVDGFRLLKLAGNDQIPNAFCMAVHESGDLIVSGPGYLRRLRISDKGLEEVKDLPHPPAGGAQGLWCEGNDLYFVGGEGLCRIKEALGDLSEEQLAMLPKPEVLLKIDVGQEHQAHAIRKGPEEWWYLICGNQTELDPKFSSHKDSPVKDPEAGCLLRLNFELEEYQVFAHGFRNAYDFDFGPDGSVYVYDSDGERDVSLPWYRPTRVFRVAAGDHAGWVSQSWKRPSYYSDMPAEVAALGRGSPTGVCYNGGQSMGGALAHNLLVGDWTFGRVVAIDVADDNKKPMDLLLSKGQFGFAVTDMVLGVDGLLYVSVGGRGTEGGLFRIEPKNSVAGTDAALPKRLVPNTGGSEMRAMVDSIRRFQLTLGGCGGCKGMMAGYTLKQPLSAEFQSAKNEMQLWGDRFDRLNKQPDNDQAIDEFFRLLAMMRIQSNELGGKVLAVLASENHPVRRIHLLNCYSFIGESASVEQATQISKSLFGLKRKIAKRGLNTDRNWEPRMKELVTALATDPRIRKAIVDSPSLGAEDTLYIAEALMNAPAESMNDSQQSAVADRALAWCRTHIEETSARHVRLIKQHADVGGFLRSVVGDAPQLLSPTVDVLFKIPVEADRATFVRGLGANRLQTQKNSSIGLRRLLDRGAESLSFEETQVTLAAIGRLSSDGPGMSVHKQMMLMLKASFANGASFPDGDLTQTRQFLEKRFNRTFKTGEDDAIDVDQWIANIVWDQGDAERGGAVFTKAQCAACHQSGNGQLGSSALGPSLEGITKRFSKRALFQSILEPSRDVADRYRAVLVETEDGDFLTGLKVYQSADGITLLLADGSTARINSDQIAELKRSNQSLMPARLLDNLKPSEIADLWAWLTTL